MISRSSSATCPGETSRSTELPSSRLPQDALEVCSVARVPSRGQSCNSWQLPGGRRPKNPMPKEALSRLAPRRPRLPLARLHEKRKTLPWREPLANVLKFPRQLPKAATPLSSKSPTVKSPPSNLSRTLPTAGKSQGRLQPRCLWRRPRRPASPRHFLRARLAQPSGSNLSFSPCPTPTSPRQPLMSSPSPVRMMWFSLRRPKVRG